MTRDDALIPLREAAQLAARRGSLLFHLDLATELARGALDREGLPTDLLAPLAGPDGYQVVALRPGAAIRTLACVTFDAEGKPLARSIARAAHPREEAVSRARQALANAFPGHATIVVPRTEPDAVEGYAVSIAEHPGAPVTEGHWRCVLTSDGRSIVSREPVAVGLLHQGGTFDSEGAVPNALHIYLSLKHGRTWSVATAASGLSWTVEGERVTLI